MDPYSFNFSWGDSEEEKVARQLGMLHDQILFEGPQKIAGIIMEPITGSNGWLRLNQEYYQGVRALCDQYGIMLIADEVMSGFYRTGPLFSFQHFEGVQPDMVTFAKGVSSAYIPFSGVGMSQEIFDHFRTNALGIGSTYAAHPVACASAYATMKHMLAMDMPNQVMNVAEPVMQEELAKIIENHPSAK